jgi:alpha-amylase
MKSAILTLGALSAYASALSVANWRQQSIYQVVTDRFALPNGELTPTCTTDFQLANYCNGTFQGIISQLDCIQGMGFTAVSFLKIT